jgi:acyl carrier protein phosphodiesterase
VNWLAHLRLSPPSPSPLLRLGNLCGDFVAGVDLATLHPELQRGIAMHRAVDRFVDAHAVVRAARERFPPPFRRFAPVLLDVFFDYFLAREWKQLGDGESLFAFVDGVHRDLDEHCALLPPALQSALPRFSREGWLLAYASHEGLARVLAAMGQRVRRANPLAQGVDVLRALEDEFARTFAVLWPELLASFTMG